MNHKHLLLFQLLNSSMTFLLIREFKTYISIVNFVRIQKSKTEGSISCFISFCVLYRKEQFFSSAMEKHNQIIVLQLSRVINEDRMKWNRDNVDKQHFSAVNMLLLFYHSLPRLLLVPSTISRHFFGKHLNFLYIYFEDFCRHFFDPFSQGPTLYQVFLFPFFPLQSLPQNR